MIIIIKIMRHFMNYMYALKLKSCESDHNIRITRNAKEDVELYGKFMEQVGAGIIMNLLNC